MLAHRLIRPALVALLLGSAGAPLRAQESKVDLAVTYTTVDSRATAGQNFWMQGGSVQLGISVFGGLGLAADLTGVHTGSIASSGVPLTLLIGTAGPRYRWHRRNVAVYGQALFGEANGFRSEFPTSNGLQSSATAFAVQVGGGIDYRTSQHFAIRVIDADWLRTKLPNSTNNTQNNLRLGAGIVARF